MIFPLLALLSTCQKDPEKQRQEDIKEVRQLLVDIKALAAVDGDAYLETRDLASDYFNNTFQSAQPQYGLSSVEGQSLDLLRERIQDSYILGQLFLQIGDLSDLEPAQQWPEKNLGEDLFQSIAFYCEAMSLESVDAFVQDARTITVLNPQKGADKWYPLHSILVSAVLWQNMDMMNSSARALVGDENESVQTALSALRSNQLQGHVVESIDGNRGQPAQFRGSTAPDQVGDILIANNVFRSCSSPDNWSCMYNLADAIAHEADHAAYYATERGKASSMAEEVRADLHGGLSSIRREGYERSLARVTSLATIGAPSSKLVREAVFPSPEDSQFYLLATQSILARADLAVRAAYPTHPYSVCAIELAGSHLGENQFDQGALQMEMEKNIQIEYNLVASSRAIRQIRSAFTENLASLTSLETTQEFFADLSSQKKGALAQMRGGREALQLSYEIQVIDAIQTALHEGLDSLDDAIQNIVVDARTNPLPDDYLLKPQ